MGWTDRAVKVWTASIPSNVFCKMQPRTLLFSSSITSGGKPSLPCDVSEIWQKLNFYNFAFIFHPWLSPGRGLLQGLLIWLRIARISHRSWIYVPLGGSKQQHVQAGAPGEPTATSDGRQRDAWNSTTTTGRVWPDTVVEGFVLSRLPRDCNMRGSFEATAGECECVSPGRIKSATASKLCLAHVIGKAA